MLYDSSKAVLSCIVFFSVLGAKYIFFMLVNIAIIIIVSYVINSLRYNYVYNMY